MAYDWKVQKTKCIISVIKNCKLNEILFSLKWQIIMKTGCVEMRTWYDFDDSLNQYQYFLSIEKTRKSTCTHFE